MNITLVFLVVAAYLVGAIPFGLLLARCRGIDVRTHGSCNIGATNVSRVLGRKLGGLTLLLDVGKGFLPMLAARQALAAAPESQALLGIALCGAAAVVGHMFPVYLGFRGGKGVATTLGVFLFLSPLAVLCCLSVFLLAVRLSGFVSLGSLLGSATVLAWLPLLGEPGWKSWLALFVVALIWIKHGGNIGRLFRGEEKSWRKAGKEGSAS